MLNADCLQLAYQQSRKSDRTFDLHFWRTVPIPRYDAESMTPPSISCTVRPSGADRRASQGQHGTRRRSNQDIRHHPPRPARVGHRQQDRRSSARNPAKPHHYYNVAGMMLALFFRKVETRLAPAEVELLVGDYDGFKHVDIGRKSGH